MKFVLFLTFLCIIPYVLSTSSLKCSTLDPKHITLITFDVFAALMDTTTSMQTHIGNVIPELTTTSARNAFVSAWITDYANHAGATFNALKQHPQPFLYTVESFLVNLLAQHGLSHKYPKDSDKFNNIVAIWGNLIPRPGTQDALLQLQHAGYKLGALSNGDRTTLSNALKVFLPKVTFQHIFSSDYPVGAFKPHPHMYQQVIDIWDIHKVLHIAGSPIDAKGARSFGMYSGLLHYPASSENPACFVLDDISKLPHQLGIHPLLERITDLYKSVLNHQGPIPPLLSYPTEHA